MSRTVINVKGLEKMSRSISMGLRSTASSPIRDTFRQWSFRYRAEMQERYDRFSKGGGDWEDLKPETKARRRHGKGGRFQRGGKALARAESSGGGSISILRDTNTLFTAFSPTFMHLPGQLEKHVPFGVVVGYGGPASHPEAKMTVARLAEIHHGGEGRNPERKLLVEPSMKTQKAMAGDMERALKKIISQSQVRPA